MFISTRRWLIGAATLLIAASAVWAAGLAKGAAAPDFTLKDISGKSFKMSANKGKVVFINFFATWCPPCRREFPEIVKLNAEFAKKGVKVISVSADDERTIARVKPFAQEYKAKHPVLLGPAALEVTRMYQLEYFPTNYLVGKDGKIREAWIGYGGPEDAKKWSAAIKAALK